MEDIAKLDEVNSRSEIKHEGIAIEDHELYATYFGSKESVDNFLSGAGPFDAEYEKCAAVCWPELMDIPLRIVHGKDDVRVPAEQAETMYDMPQALEKDVELQIDSAGHMDLPLSVI